MEEQVLRIPQYRKLYELLRKHIVDGLYKEGDYLPSENDLCAVHSVTRPTVRQALGELVKDGFIKKQKGKGSIVKGIPKGIGILSIAGTTSVLGKQNLSTQIILKPDIRPWPEPFMFDLSQEEKESGCIYMERLRLVGGEAIFYDINWLPNINLPRFASRKFDNKSLFDTLRENYQIEIKGGEQKIRAMTADSNISRHLNLKEGDPVLHLERKIETNRIGYSIYSSIYCNTEKHSLYGIF